MAPERRAHRCPQTESLPPALSLHLSSSPADEPAPPAAGLWPPFPSAPLALPASPVVAAGAQHVKASAMSSKTFFIARSFLTLSGKRAHPRACEDFSAGRLGHLA